MDELIENHVTFELLEESLCKPTDITCPVCQSSLLFDPVQAEQAGCQ